MSEKIKIVTHADSIDQLAWNELVGASHVATWFQTPEAYAFFDSISFLQAFVVAVENNGQLKGLVVGYIQKDGGKIKQFLSRRAVIIGGPLLDENIADSELVALLMAVKNQLRKKAIYIETRNFNDYSKWKTVFADCGFEYEQHLNYHVDCINSDKPFISLKENRRRQVTKAIKEGVVIEEASSEEDVYVFYKILKKLYENKVKQPLFSIEFFIKLYKMKSTRFFLVKYNRDIIGGIVSPILDQRTIYEWFVCGCDDCYKKQYPSVMATWAAIDYARKNNIEKFDFMGAGSPNKSYGVRDFKEKFGGTLVEHGRFRCVCNPLLFKLGILGVKIMKKL